jgi:excisionase family DNA binding protein
VQQVAEEVQCSIWTIYRYVNAGELRGVRFEREWRFRRGDVDTWIERRLRPAPMGVAFK